MNGRAKSTISEHDRLVFNRKLVVFVHVMLASCATLVYLNQINLAAFPYWQSRSALGIVFLAIPPSFPYIVSVLHAWSAVTARRFGLFVFVVVLLSGTGAYVLFVSGALGVKVDGSNILGALVIQTAVYYWSGELLLTT